MRRKLLLEENKKLYLYKAGNQCTDVTGGWKMHYSGHSSNYLNKYETYM